MKKKPDLKPGDKFGLYYGNGSRCVRVFSRWRGDDAIAKDDTETHYMAMQFVIRKKKLRTWWINEAVMRRKDPWNTWFETKDGDYVRTTPPEDLTGWIKVVETKKGVSG